MKSFIIVALALVAVATAATVVEPIPIVKSNFDQQPEGSYVFNYESADGSVRSEVGELKEALDEENKPHKVVVVRGTYSYTDVNGKPETVNYYADENGYRAEGSSIPKPTRR